VYLVEHLEGRGFEGKDLVALALRVAHDVEEDVHPLVVDRGCSYGLRFGGWGLGVGVGVKVGGWGLRVEGLVSAFHGNDMWLGQGLGSRV
jgi:hypothetical protein